MIAWKKSVAGACLALTSASAMAQDGGNGPSRWAGAEVAAGVFEHGANFHPLADRLVFDLPKLPAGQIYEGSEEDGTVDVQLVVRSVP